MAGDGPVTLGLGLLHAGLPTDAAFALSESSVHARVAALGTAIAEALPDAPQVVFIDEPGLTGLAHPGFPLEPERGDRARRVVHQHCRVVRTHRCPLLRIDGLVPRRTDGRVDPVAARRPLRGAVRGHRSPTSWHEVDESRGAQCRPTDRARERPIVTGGHSPRCGASSSAPGATRFGCVRRRSSRRSAGSRPTPLEQAEQVLALTQEIADRVLDQAVATRFSLGA